MNSFNRLFAFIGELVSENGSASTMRWCNLMVTFTACFVVFAYTLVLISKDVPLDFPVGASALVGGLLAINYGAKIIQKKEEVKTETQP